MQSASVRSHSPTNWNWIYKMKTKEQTKWVTLKQASEITGLTKRALQRRCKCGYYKAKRVRMNGGLGYKIQRSSLVSKDAVVVKSVPTSLSHITVSIRFPIQRSQEVLSEFAEFIKRFNL